MFIIRDKVEREEAINDHKILQFQYYFLSEN